MINIEEYLNGKIINLFEEIPVTGNFYYVENNIHRDNKLQMPVLLHFTNMKICLQYCIFKVQNVIYKRLYTSIYDIKDEAEDELLRQNKLYVERCKHKNLADWYPYLIYENSLKDVIKNMTNDYFKTLSVTKEFYVYLKENGLILYKNDKEYFRHLELNDNLQELGNKYSEMGIQLTREEYMLIG